MSLLLNWYFMSFQRKLESKNSFITRCNNWIPAFAGMTKCLLPVLILLNTGCGVYKFSGHGIAGIETISVAPFDNQTSEFGIREALTDELVNRLLTNRTLTIAGQSAADAVLSGTIISVTDAPLSFDEDEEASENKVTIVVQVTLHKRGQSEPIWSGRLVGDGNYPYQTGNPEDREAGINKAVERLVQDLVNRLTSDW